MFKLRINLVIILIPANMDIVCYHYNNDDDTGKINDNKTAIPTVIRKSRRGMMTIKILITKIKQKQNGGA